MPGLTAEVGNALAQAAGVCLDSQQHASGTLITVALDYPSPSLKRMGDFTMTGTKRDLEKEREALLRILKKNTHPDVKRAIEAAIARSPDPQAPKVTHTTKGTDDAYVQ